MKLEKVTSEKGRRYHDACGAAHGLDLVGDRWALLVMRELMLGPRRFGDLRRDLCGVSANVLTQRLEGLEASGLVHKRKLAPPASVQVYEATEWGLEIEPVFMVLGRWAARSPGHDPTLPLSAVSLMLSFKTMFDPGLAGGGRMTLGFALGEDRMVVRVADGRLEAWRGEAEDADVVVTATPPLVAAAVYGKVPLRALVGLALEGDAAVFERFVGFFHLPPKAEVTS